MLEGLLQTAEENVVCCVSLINSSFAIINLYRQKETIIKLYVRR
jgi:hypothetical protein